MKFVEVLASMEARKLRQGDRSNRTAVWALVTLAIGVAASIWGIVLITQSWRSSDFTASEISWIPLAGSLLTIMGIQMLEKAGQQRLLAATAKSADN